MYLNMCHMLHIIFFSSCEITMVYPTELSNQLANYMERSSSWKAKSCKPVALLKIL
jgi:hypothetical protein